MNCWFYSIRVKHEQHAEDWRKIMNYALELKNVCKQYDGFALKDVNIALPQGCIMGLSLIHIQMCIRDSQISSHRCAGYAW